MGLLMASSRRFRAWLACRLQWQRRNRVPEVSIVLSSDGHGHLTWTCSVIPEYVFTIAYSDDGIVWTDYADGANPTDTSRDMSGTGGYFRIARTDADGLAVLPWSNVVYSDGL